MTRKLEFSAAEIGALAHLYRGEVYRSTAWRTRLDSTTNWAVVTTGIALSATFSSAEASPLSMVLVGIIVSVSLLFEARRYRHFNTWRARARLLETDFYAAMIRGEGVQLDSAWAELLATIAIRATTSASPARLVDGFAVHTPGPSSSKPLRTTVSSPSIRRRWPPSPTFGNVPPLIVRRNLSQKL
jgi:hypothetical protein